jgi:hypothetical protein
MSFTLANSFSTFSCSLKQGVTMLIFFIVFILPTDDDCHAHFSGYALPCIPPDDIPPDDIPPDDIPPDDIPLHALQ